MSLFYFPATLPFLPDVLASTHQILPLDTVVSGPHLDPVGVPSISVCESSYVPREGNSDRIVAIVYLDSEFVRELPQLK